VVEHRTENAGVISSTLILGTFTRSGSAESRILHGKFGRRSSPVPQATSNTLSAARIGMQRDACYLGPPHEVEAGDSVEVANRASGSPVSSTRSNPRQRCWPQARFSLVAGRPNAIRLAAGAEAVGRRWRGADVIGDRTVDACNRSCWRVENSAAGSSRGVARHRATYECQRAAVGHAATVARGRTTWERRLCPNRMIASNRRVDQPRVARGASWRIAAVAEAPALRRGVVADGPANHLECAAVLHTARATGRRGVVFDDRIDQFRMGARGQADAGHTAAIRGGVAAHHARDHFQSSATTGRWQRIGVEDSATEALVVVDGAIRSVVDDDSAYDGHRPANIGNPATVAGDFAMRERQTDQRDGVTGADADDGVTLLSVNDDCPRPAFGYKPDGTRGAGTNRYILVVRSRRNGDRR
jgi:hypothetical protein